jgi:uncharacterized protein
MKSFSLLVKPASADCNLSCQYCFYLDKCRQYLETKKHRMSDKVLTQLLKTYMETQQSVYALCWQGGEPTLMGTNFFSTVVEYQKKYGRAGSRISNSVQTNATLITKDMAVLFSTYHFLVGCSLDGPADIHDMYRRTQTNGSTHQMVVKGIETLKQYQVQFNILTLVSRSNVDRAHEVYNYLKKIGVGFIQFIPCVEFDEKGNLLPFAITPDQWGCFLCDIFDQWYPKDIFSISIRNFDSILSRKTDGTNTVCVTGDNCCQYFVVEYNGDIYPCDFFVEDRLKLGNIMETSWEKLISSPSWLEFGRQKKEWHYTCNTCEYLELCGGDCLKHRMFANNPSHNISWLCQGYKSFFKHTQSRFNTLCNKIKTIQLKGER